MKDSDRILILTLHCCDQIGIVAAISGFLAENRYNIEEAHQFSDPLSGDLFMRLAFSAPKTVKRADINTAFQVVADQFDMAWELFDEERPTRTVIMVSKFTHCLADLLYRQSIGALNMEVTSVVSNHLDARDMVERQGIKFHHIPVTKDTKANAEAEFERIIEVEDAELVVLARYMQILSDDMSKKLSGKVINIHHSFLPSFKGAKPYHRAYERGVKLIGATAHYVTADLDEGPIIEQMTERVDHAMSPDDLVAAGRDVEAQVLARAVKYHTEHRAFINHGRTVIFK